MDIYKKKKDYLKDHYRDIKFNSNKKKIIIFIHKGRLKCNLKNLKK